MPVGALHRGAQVVQHQPPGHAAERQERVLDAPDEALRVLPEHRLAVSLAGVREHEAEHPAAPPAAVGPEDRRPQAEVHLRLLARGALHARDAVPVAGRQAADVPLDRVVRSAETMVAAQILEDALRRQTRLDAPRDLVVVRRAQARRNPGGHPGWFWFRAVADPGGHPGWFWFRAVAPGGHPGWFWVGPEPDTPRNRPAVKLQQPRDTPVGDALPV